MKRKVRCECKKKGLRHWWKYLRFRLYWRDFCARMRYKHQVINGKDIWVEEIWTAFGNISLPRVYTKYPGPPMSCDEYEHWFLGGDRL